MKYFRNVICLTEILLISLAAAILHPDTETNPNEITNSYIIVLKDEVSQSVFSQHFLWLKETNEQLSNPRFAGQKHQYDIGAFKGYAGEFNDLTIERIRARPEVCFETRDSTLINMILTSQGCVYRKKRNCQDIRVC